MRDFAKDVPVTGAAVPSGGSKSEPDGDGDGDEGGCSDDEYMDGQKQQGGEGEGEEEEFKPTIVVKISDKPIKQVARGRAASVARGYGGWVGCVWGGGVNTRGWGGGVTCIERGGAPRTHGAPCTCTPCTPCTHPQATAGDLKRASSLFAAPPVSGGTRGRSTTGANQNVTSAPGSRRGAPPLPPILPPQAPQAPLPRRPPVNLPTVSHHPRLTARVAVAQP